ncbi:MAG TPA: YkgJ family cysteine cluster protein [Terracidiphilus sp.]|jgi:Fe-S-cluster containining protein|nr:YkgJ family cysteine cluster protein [Terracidiphilus sp.]
MGITGRDRALVQIMDAALADAARRAGAWLACKPGCTPCCHGAFAINALDVERLRGGLEVLHAADPDAARAVVQRAHAWLAEFGAEFPGDTATGILGTSDEEQARFEEFANDAPCPALDPATGLCAVYDARPMTCRVFGPPVRMGAGPGSSEGAGEALGCCELCFAGASDAEIAACEMPVPHALEEELLAETGDANQTVVAFALLR